MNSIIIVKMFLRFLSSFGTSSFFGTLSLLSLLLLSSLGGVGFFISFFKSVAQLDEYATQK